MICQFEALLKLYDDAFRMDDHLSIQELIDVICRDYLGANGAIDQLIHAWEALVVQGTVYEEINQLSYSLDNSDNPRICGADDETEVFRLSNMVVFDLECDNGDGYNLEDHLEHVLLSSPVAATIPSFYSYNDIQGNAVYVPTDAELVTLERNEYFHTMLCVGRGIDPVSGLAYFEFQDSNGYHFGDRGFVRVAAGLGLIREFVVMTL